MEKLLPYESALSIGDYIEFTPPDRFNNSVPETFFGKIIGHWVYENSDLLYYQIEWLHNTPTKKHSNCSIYFIASNEQGFRHLIKLSPTEPLRKQFNQLVENWVCEGAQSNPHNKLLNKNYLKIISLGKNVVPFILEDMRKEPKLWFLALEVLTGENPVNPEIKSNFSDCTKAWIDWGIKNKFIE